MIQLQIHQCEWARDNTRELSLSALGFVERSIADVWWHAGESAHAHHQVHRAVAVYESANDPVGAAACHAFECDFALAPWSSALVRNLQLFEGIYPTSELAWPIEEREGATATVDVAAATELIARSRALAEKAGATRVLGFLSLCEGYLARIRRDHSRQLEHTASAVDIFRNYGDEIHFQLAVAHNLLARIDAGRMVDDREESGAIGTWGQLMAASLMRSGSV